MNKKFKPVPVFKSEAEERTFWESHDSTDYVGWSRAERVRFPNLKPSDKAIAPRAAATKKPNVRVTKN